MRRILPILASLFLTTLSMAISFGISRADPFWFGVGHSAFQVEGTPEDSDWREWTRTPGRIKDGTNADHATDFWNNYEEDFKSAKQLGAKMFRMSIAWERIQPSPNQFNEAALAHYEKILVACRAQGLEPLVTLHHFTLPSWLAREGGVTSPQFPNLFLAYAMNVVERLARPPAKVVWWMTFNEPMVLVNSGYLTGEWPPGLKDPELGMKAAANLAKAHILAYASLKKIPNTHLQIGLAAHLRDFQPQDGSTFAELLNKGFTKLSDWAFNRQFLSSITKRKILFWMPDSKVEYENLEWMLDGPAYDYLGVNYYGRMMVRATKQAPFVEIKEGPGPKTDLGWEIYPRGLYDTLKLAQKYAGKRPLLISENGLADAADSRRAEFIRAHLDQVRQARADGIPVIGYLHWSLTDNFEWAEGLTPRFGLVEIDYATGKRKPRPSFEAYRKMIVDGMP